MGMSSTSSVGTLLSPPTSHGGYMDPPLPPTSSSGGILSPFRGPSPINHFQPMDQMMGPPPLGSRMSPPGSGGSGGGGPMHPDSQMHGPLLPQDRLQLQQPPASGIGPRPPPRGSEAAMYQGGGGGPGDMTHMGPIPPARQAANGGMMRQHMQQSHYPFDRGPPDGMPYRNDSAWGREGYGNNGSGGMGPPQGGPVGGNGGGMGYNNSMPPRQQSQGGFQQPLMQPPSHLGGGGSLGGPGTSNRSGMATAHDILELYKDVGDDNEIVKHARTMLISAQSMHNFTLGEGRVKTTQDFFTKAEAFSEDANKMYKLVRMFSYQVPSGEDKRILMQSADNLPRHCGQMQLLIQLPGMGKESTFRKVDSIIKENNQIMHRVGKVVELCFMNAKKYDLDFRGITLSNGAGDGTDTGSPFGSGSGGAGSGSSSLASDIGFGSSRRSGAPAAGNGGNKRTRVSFLLY